jgi:hypothetical protein
MTNATMLRAEAERLRTLARCFTDSKVLTAIHQLVEELERRERRAREIDNGNADGS